MTSFCVVDLLFYYLSFLCKGHNNSVKMCIVMLCFFKIWALYRWSCAVSWKWSLIGCEVIRAAEMTGGFKATKRVD